MYQAIVFLPLLGFLIAGLFGRMIGARASEVVTTALLSSSAASLSWIAFFSVGFGSGGHSRAGRALDRSRATSRVDWAFRIDTLTAVMLVVVNTVSALVHLYSIGYMHDDPASAALLRLSVAVHLRHADAGDGRQPRADVLRLGGRRPRVLPADRLLVPEAVGERGGDQGLHRQPRRRFRLRPRHLPRLRAVRLGRLRPDLRRQRRRNSPASAFHFFGHRLATR